MSMTQEEIEALMNETTDTSSDSEEQSIDDLLDGIDGIVKGDDEDIELDNIIEDNDIEIQNDNDNKEENIDELLSENTHTKEVQIDEDIQNIEEINKEEKTLEDKIDEGMFPLPSSDENRVVNQLNQVAEDTEEKASQMFDSLSFLLDENEKITSKLDNNKEFISSQISLLQQLNAKFPNIQVIKDNLEKANVALNNNDDALSMIQGENLRIFEAMELMQYHDINRQKIERVMSVIKKLANYLNGIFIDESNKSEVKIAKHISGDSYESINEDELDNLIDEFNK